MNIRKKIRRFGIRVTNMIMIVYYVYLKFESVINKTENYFSSIGCVIINDNIMTAAILGWQLHLEIVGLLMYVCCLNARP